MKVVFLAPGWPPSRFPNGIVTAVSALAPALRALGHEARILAVGGDSDGDPDVATLQEAAPPPRAPNPVRLLRNRLAPHRILYREVPDRIARGIERHPLFADADIFEMEESFGWSARVAARAAIPVVTRLHGPWFLVGAAGSSGAVSRADRLRIACERESVIAAAGVSAPSQFVLNAVREHYETRLDNAVVISNPVTPAAEEDVWRAENSNKNELLFIGRFDRIKGADILLDAFAMLASERPALRLIFAGPDSGVLEADGAALSFETYLRARLAPEIASRVERLGVIERRRIATLRKRAAVTIVASRIENFSGAVAEAMAAGSPLVTTAVGGTPEVARAGIDALLAEVDPHALAQQIAALLDNPDLAASLGAKARKRALADFAPEKIAERTAAFHADVIARENALRRRAG